MGVLPQNVAVAGRLGMTAMIMHRKPKLMNKEHPIRKTMLCVRSCRDLTKPLRLFEEVAGSVARACQKEIDDLPAASP